ncbi:MAG: hypothetical protein JXA49_06160 [Actinobacteria bacterium]|nr:hypothetical protein [Actinomycetota bacterium]
MSLRQTLINPQVKVLSLLRVDGSLSCDKDCILFTSSEKAGAHCKMGAFLFGNQVKLDWLGGVTGH